MKHQFLPFHDRKIWTYYLLFFAGTLTLVYQAMNARQLGDSVDLLCLLFLLGSFSVRRKIHILENAALVTCGYILPLLIRNTMKLSYSEAPSRMYFIELATQSAIVTFGLGCIFSFVGWYLRRGFYAIRQKRKAEKLIQSIQKKQAEEENLNSANEESSLEKNPIL